jgi:hypothetical protein
MHFSYNDVNTLLIPRYLKKSNILSMQNTLKLLKRDDALQSPDSMQVHSLRSSAAAVD